METEAFISKIEAAGFHLAVDGDKLMVAPVAKLTNPQRQFIRQHKPELLRALTGKKPVEPPTSPKDATEPGGIVIHVPTPNGGMVRFLAQDQAHADWIMRMNPCPSTLATIHTERTTTSGYPATVRNLAREIGAMHGCSPDDALSLLGPDDCRALKAGDMDMMGAWGVAVQLATRRGELEPSK